MTEKAINFKGLLLSAFFACASISAVLPGHVSAAATQSAVKADATFNASPIPSYQGMLSTLSKAAPTADPKVLKKALTALDCALTSGLSPARNLTVIDYSIVSTKPRLWVFDLTTGKVLFNELVSHGAKTGKAFAENFSNIEGSHQTSLGLFRTKHTYMGANGYSLRMEGLEEGFNDNAMQRAIVFHGADYVSPEFAKKMGYLGRSHGCPAVNNGVAKKVIDVIKGDQFVFSYYPDQKWLSESSFLNCRQTQRVARN